MDIEQQLILNLEGDVDIDFITKNFNELKNFIEAVNDVEYLEEIFEKIVFKINLFSINQRINKNKIVILFKIKKIVVKKLKKVDVRFCRVFMNNCAIKKSISNQKRLKLIGEDRKKCTLQQKLKNQTNATMEFEKLKIFKVVNTNLKKPIIPARTNKKLPPTKTFSEQSIIC